MADLLTLQPHPATPCAAVHSLQVALERTAEGGLRLQYRLSGELDRIRIPETQTPAFTDGLWEHTCFEAFIGVRGENGYHEFNFSPSGQWAAYAFSGYRERVEWDVNNVPLISTGDEVFLEALLPASVLPPNPENKLFELNLTAVIEITTSEKSYWALKHPTDRPDFHHRDSFAFTLMP